MTIGIVPVACLAAGPGPTPTAIMQFYFEFDQFSGKNRKSVLAFPSCISPLDNEILSFTITEFAQAAAKIVLVAGASNREHYLEPDNPMLINFLRLLRVREMNGS